MHLAQLRLIYISINIAAACIISMDHRRMKLIMMSMATDRELYGECGCVDEIIGTQGRALSCNQATI